MLFFLAYVNFYHGNLPTLAAFLAAIGVTVQAMAVARREDKATNSAVSEAAGMTLAGIQFRGDHGNGAGPARKRREIGLRTGVGAVPGAQAANATGGLRWEQSVMRWSCPICGGSSLAMACR
jgi:hypothetical protein